MPTRNEKTMYSISGAVIGAMSAIDYSKRNNLNENLALNEIFERAVLGLGLGYLASHLFGDKDDTVNYTLYLKQKRVYDGVTFEERIQKRIAEHKKSGKKFTRIVFDDAKPRIEALSLEKETIMRYKPPYNKIYNL
jgi:hypothetical protein